MKRRTFLSLFTVALLLNACGKSKKLPFIPAGKAVLAFGDSVTFGTGATPGEDWPTLLARQTGWLIENAGIPGDTAEAGKRRFASLLELHKPTLVIIEIGGNDFLRRRAPKAVKEDLRSMIHAARQEGAQVVLIAVPELSLLGALTRAPADSPIYEELGDEEKIPVIGQVFSEILSHPELCADQIHPNAKGYQHMAEGFYKALVKIGLAKTTS